MKAVSREINSALDQMNIPTLTRELLFNEHAPEILDSLELAAKIVRSISSHHNLSDSEIDQVSEICLADLHK